MRNNFNTGDIISIVVYDFVNHEKIEEAWTAIYNDSSQYDVSFFFALDNHNHIHINNYYEFQDGEHIRYATREEKDNLFNNLKNNFLISYPNAAKYISDTTMMDLENWLMNILNIDDDITPDFIMDVRDEVWDKLTENDINRFNPKSLKPFDKVLVRTPTMFFWEIEFFGRYDEDADVEKYKCLNGWYSECIPFNKETEYLLGTMENPPMYYCI